MTSTTEAAIASLKEAGLGDVLHLPDSQTYNDRTNSYWSLTAQLRPWAIVQPRTTEEVAKALKALVNTPDVKFAVRSGGHMAWAGANNINDGVTIDLGLMTKTTYNPETKLASIEPGGRWTDVYSEVERNGVMVAGGREGLVGVGGLLTGGGKTFYTCRYGFACDQVVNYEVVLADGSVVEANATTNPDLFRVLKGGGNNFGIVTRFDMATFEAKNIWDGNLIVAKEQMDAVIDAFVDFTAALKEKPDSHVLVMWTWLPQSTDPFIMLVLTHLDGVENAPSLEKFTSIPGQKTMQVTSLAKKVASFLVPSGKQDTWFTLTYKLDARIVKKTADVFEKMGEKLRGLIPAGDFYISLVLQPLPTTFGAHSAARGGNMFGLDRIADDCVLLVAAVEVATPEISETIGFPALRDAIAEIEAYAESVAGNVGFRYLNYCDGSQDPFATYGADNIRKMKDAAAKYDPTGVFQTRVPGGFKISKV
ncbi:hypothetical protein SLS62_002478 [Diatrype stigma]|uniref:FAD-binding PCMH-type domain-containing protein n=1 Tax=Diatrype stigma TaxID=117547 RepID=A0AAN9UU48_9PEZI